MKFETLFYDLEFWLVSATLLCGLIWLLYALFGKKPEVDENGDVKEPILMEYAKAFFPVLLLVVFLRSFIAEPFRIPSGSMMPTLEVGDFILVNKFAYGIRIPVLRKKIIDTGEPKRGDVFVFRFPSEPWKNFIKRVVGLPGDKIRWQDDKLYINDELIPNTDNGDYNAIDQYGTSKGADRRIEQLGDVSHDIIFMNAGLRNPRDLGNKLRSGEEIVPEGHYFAMGDNRFGSHDSRGWGFVPEANLVGKALFVWMHYSGNDKKLDVSRIGTSIK